MRSQPEPRAVVLVAAPGLVDISRVTALICFILLTLLRMLDRLVAHCQNKPVFLLSHTHGQVLCSGRLCALPRLKPLQLRHVV